MSTLSKLAATFQDQAPQTSLSDVFLRNFEVVEADTPELLDQVHRLRYQVFCIENKGFEDPSAHPDRLESDVYDDHSTHALLTYKPTNTPLGTIRVVLPNHQSPEHSFPLQDICGAAPLHDENSIKNSCEISRFCISLERHSHIKDELNRHGQSYGSPAHVRRALGFAPIGIISGGFNIALKNNLLNCYGIMEPHHLEKLVHAGLKHKPLGENIDYHGERTPFTLNIQETFENTRRRSPEIWSIVSKRGAYHTLADRISYRQRNTYNESFAFEH